MSYRLLNQHPAVYVLDPRLIENRLDAAFFKPEYADFDKAVVALDFEVFELGSRRVTSLLTHMPGFSKDKWVRYVPDGIPYLLQTNVQDGFIEPTGWEHITPEAHQNLKTSSLTPGDVLLTATGMHYGKAAVVPEWLREANACPDIFHIVLRKQVDPYYAVAYINSRYGQIELQRHGSGANRPRIITEYVRMARLVLPPRLIQDYIGAKVRLAERCRLRARELWTDSAQVLSQGTGISLETEHFEHVDEKRLRTASYQLVGASPMQIWVRQDLVEHELGPQYFHPRRANVILKLRTSGIELKRLTDLTSRIADRITPERITEVPYYVGLADIDTTTGYFEQKETARGDVLGTSALFKANDILFSKLRPYLNKVAICPAHIPQACGSTELLVYRAHRTTLPYYIFFVLKSNLGLFQILDVTTGSTLPRVDPEIVDDILVPMIAREDQLAIDRNVRTALHLRHQASQLVSEAKADVEALVEGRLDVDGIIAGRVWPPTWEEIEV